MTKEEKQIKFVQARMIESMTIDEVFDFILNISDEDFYWFCEKNMLKYPSFLDFLIDYREERNNTEANSLYPSTCTTFNKDEYDMYLTSVQDPRD